MSYKVVIVGAAGAGKTSLLNQYAFSKFQVQVPTTIGVEVCHKELDEETHLCIWDTAGQERFQSVGSHLYRGACAVLFVYDISSKQSFDCLETWWRQFRTFGNPQNAVSILVGNKLDLPRAVSTEMAKAWAVSKGICYKETSAKNNVHVHETFSTLVQQLQRLPSVQEDKYRTKQQPKSDRCCY